jgi:hypothetical protein
VTEGGADAVARIGQHRAEAQAGGLERNHSTEYHRAQWIKLHSNYNVHTQQIIRWQIDADIFFRKSSFHWSVTRAIYLRLRAEVSIIGLVRSLPVPGIAASRGPP